MKKVLACLLFFLYGFTLFNHDAIDATVSLEGVFSSAGTVLMFLLRWFTSVVIACAVFEPFFNNKISATLLYILEKYKNTDHISLMRDYDSLRKISHGKFTYANFAKLKELAKNSVGYHDENTDLLISTYISLINNFNEKIDPIEKQISTIIKELNPRMLSIPGLGEISAATILSEYGDIKNFSSPNKMLAFAGLEPSIIESGTLQSNGKMVKHGSGHLRYSIMNTAMIILRYSPTFYDYYLKKRSEGKCHRVALSHVSKKLIRVIYHLEKNNVKFDPSLLK